MEIKGVIAAAGHHLGLLDAYGLVRRKLTKSQVAILMYHRVCPKRDSWSLKPLSPRNFEKQIEYFCRNYEILSLDKLAQCLQEGKPLPERAVVITFDDGYKDNYLYAYPILRKYRIPAAIFLVTGHIGNANLFWWDKVSYAVQHASVERLSLDELGSHSLRSRPDKSRANLIVTERLKKLPDEKKNLLIDKLVQLSGVEIPVDLGRDLILSWDEVKEMSNGDVSFGAHSVIHPILTNMPLEQAKYEIIQSKKDIEEKLGQRVTAFSYPNGDFNAELVKFVKESAFTCAVTTSPSELITSKDSPYQLSRIAAIEDFNGLKVMLCGLWGDLQGILSHS
jgi:peptidoglycan/xylan/chitin deacetylase (PgdA/CDA1 family)